MGVNSLPKTVTRQRRDCDLNPGPSAPDSITLTTRLASHPKCSLGHVKRSICAPPLSAQSFGLTNVHKVTDLPTKRISSITATKISRHFTYKMAAKTAAVDMKQNYVTVTYTCCATCHERQCITDNLHQ